MSSAALQQRQPATRRGAERGDLTIGVDDRLVGMGVNGAGGSETHRHVPGPHVARADGIDELHHPNLRAEEREAEPPAPDWDAVTRPSIK